MTKHKNVPAITEAARAASLVGRQVAAMQKEARRIDAAEIDRSNGSLQLVVSADHISAMIRRGKVTVQIEDDEFAVTSQG